MVSEILESSKAPQFVTAQIRCSVSPGGIPGTSEDEASERGRREERSSQVQNSVYDWLCTKSEPSDLRSSQFIYVREKAP
ncbi:hypothetical protein RUM43_004416 [Polyplax serrata]|uniref:Uncharacterized protein n=1 Tax=Polyplax serrata TaxID=468196 RepID=A0AAN8SBL1_POLSC